jgi:hypothetical protein
MSTFSHPETDRVGDEASDEILPRVRHRLKASPYLALRLICCSCNGSRLVLHGRVPSYYLKQLAQVTVSQCIAGPAIENRLEVA